MDHVTSDLQKFYEKNEMSSDKLEEFEKEMIEIAKQFASEVNSIKNKYQDINYNDVFDMVMEEYLCKN